MPGTLYLVATPIGNLQDITLRALEVLRTVDLIACEDTRHTQKLLNYFRISARTISYHEHNEQERADELADRLLAGGSVAIVSDAGTPGIADPGFRIVGRAIEIDARVVAVPGAVAFISAAIVSGLPTDAIFFGGFLPAKKGDRRRRLEELRDVPATLVLYETPHRLNKALIDCFEILGDRRAAVVRELTKIHEEAVRGSLAELTDHFRQDSPKGEIVLIIERGSSSPRPSDVRLADRVTELEAEGLTPKAALKKAAKEFGMSKSDAYREWTRQRNES
jgi:16S rRNA (cytidine1402-2'-O)-methyltransferase